MKLTKCEKTQSDGKPGWLLLFPYNKDFIVELKQEISSKGRKFNPNGKTWWVSELYEDALDKLFENFERLAAPQGTNFYSASPQETKTKADSALAVGADAAGAKDRPGEVLATSPLEILKQRVAVGNLKLIKAWAQIKDLPGDKFGPLYEQWNEAFHKLLGCCDELHAMGFKDCPYIENGKKTRQCTDKSGDILCWACPSECKYWDEELFVVKPRHIHVPVSQFPVEFFKESQDGKVQ